MTIKPSKYDSYRAYILSNLYIKILLSKDNNLKQNFLKYYPGYSKYTKVSEIINLHQVNKVDKIDKIVNTLINDGNLNGFNVHEEKVYDIFMNAFNKNLINKSNITKLFKLYESKTGNPLTKDLRNAVDLDGLKTNLSNLYNGSYTIDKSSKYDDGKFAIIIKKLADIAYSNNIEPVKSTINKWVIVSKYYKK
jgi:hypothetical protein